MVEETETQRHGVIYEWRFVSFLGCLKLSMSKSECQSFHLTDGNFVRSLLRSNASMSIVIAGSHSPRLDNQRMVFALYPEIS